jgi:hypothetical protein
MRAAFVALVAACAPEAPAVAPPPADPIVGHWTIVDHLLSPKPEVGESDAFLLHDRVVDITAGGYTTPWHGSCGEAGRQLTPEAIGDVATLHELGAVQEHFKLAPDVVEYVLTCVDNKRTPPLTIWLAGDRTMTCWNGVCYLLARRR